MADAVPSVVDSECAVVVAGEKRSLATAKESTYVNRYLICETWCLR